MFDDEPGFIDLDTLVADPGMAPVGPWQSKAPDYLFTGSKPPITNTEDLRRIIALPRRPQLDEESDRAHALVELMTQRYARPRTTPCDCAKIAPKRFEHGRKGCITRLNVVQSWGLYETGIVQGLEGAIGVGHGKTILDLLAPLALADAWVAEAKRRGQTANPEKYTALLLIPPGLVDQLGREYDLLAQHFRVPSIVFHTRPIRRECAGEPWLHVYPYSKLSRAEATTFFSTLKPHAVIADESHMIGDPESVRGGRVVDYFETVAPATRQCNWTGSLTDSSIEDYAHLCKMALKNRSPLPLDPEIVKEWATCLDPVKPRRGEDGESYSDDDWRADPGALLDGLIASGCQEPGEHVYKGFHRRLVETLGFVATRSPAIDAELEISERTPHVAEPCPWVDDHVPNTPRPDERAPEWKGLKQWPGIADCLTMVRDDKHRPDGEELLEAFAIARCARELASGFFYRWIFPRGEPESVIKAWKKARKEYRCEVREKMRDRREHLDSPYLYQLAAMRYYGDIPRGGIVEIIDEETGELKTVDTTHLPEWKCESWPAWRDIRNEVQPKTEPVWIDEYLAQDAADWALEHRGIVWYDHGAFGKMVAKLSGLPMHGGGPEAGVRLLGGELNGVKYPGADGKTSIICSIKSHGTGRDGLQFLYNEQLVANPMSSNDGWEQLLGRLHRIGQPEPIVRTWMYRHTDDLDRHIGQALTRALYVQSTIGASQKLRVGFKLRDDEE